MNKGLFSSRSLSRMGARHPWRMIGGWIIFIALVLALASFVGGEDKGFADDAGLTVSPESVVGDRLIDEHFGTDNRASDLVVIRSDSASVDDPVFKDTVNQLMSNLAGWQPDFASVTNYCDLAAQGAPEAKELVSDNRQSLIIPITFNEAPDAYDARGEDFLNQIAGASNDTVQTYGVGGISANETFNTIVGEDLSGCDALFGNCARSIRRNALSSRAVVPAAGPATKK